MRACTRALMIAAVALPSARAQQAPAREAMPVGITRGNLLSFYGGLLEIQQKDGAVYECSYDAHTLFQRDRWPIQADDLNRGEPVEVLSDHKPGTRICYTRMLSVMRERPIAPLRMVQGVEPAETAHAAPKPAAQPRTSRFIPRGYLTFAGLVIRNDASSITLRGRAGDRTILLRADTRFSENGLLLERPDVLVNKHVFVRGGRNLYGGVEAYQVAWGEIFSTR